LRVYARFSLLRTELVPFRYRVRRVTILRLLLATARLAISLLGPAAQARAKNPPHAGLWVGGTSFSRSSRGLGKSARLDLYESSESDRFWKPHPDPLMVAP
jgi:hypothetical protein